MRRSQHGVRCGEVRLFTSTKCVASSEHNLFDPVQGFGLEGVIGVS